MTAAELNTAGTTRGFNDGRRYATGTKADRREIRRRIAKVKAVGGGEWCEGYLAGLTDVVEQRAEAIKAGLVRRSIRPTKLWALINR